MATKKGKGRGGWAKTQSLSSIYSKNTLAHVEELSFKSLAPAATTTHVKLPVTTSAPPILPKNAAAAPTGPSIERAPTTRHSTPQEIPATRPTAPPNSRAPPTALPNSRAPTTTYETEVTSARTHAGAPTPTVAPAHTLRPSSSHAVDPNTEEIESSEIRGSPLMEEDHAGSKYLIFVLLLLSFSIFNYNTLLKSCVLKF